MNYFLETEVKPIQVDNGLSLHQRYQSMRYRASGSPAASRRAPGRLRSTPGSAMRQTRLPPMAGASLGQASAHLVTQPFTDYGHPEFTVARREVAYGGNPFPSGLNEVG